ncbi:MAG: hypothetical protein VW270_30360 [Candidatus Poseidoniales archaeon]|jgi:hypothetical protein
MKQNIDYQLIPSDDGDKSWWDIRFLTGDFVETVIRFDTVKVSDDGEYLKYNINVISSPDDDLDPETNEDLQNVAGDVLMSLMEEAIALMEQKDAEKNTDNGTAR